MTIAPKLVKAEADEELAEYFDAVFPSLPGSDKIDTLRKDAYGRFEALGLPHRRIEEWKYTDLRSRIRVLSDPGAGSVGLSEAELGDALGPFAGMDAVRVVFVNGVYEGALSTETKDSSISVSSMADALREAPATLLDNLGAVNPPDKEEAVIAFNTALMRDGALVRIEGSPTKPVHLAFVTVGDQAQTIVTRNMVSVADGVNATILETHVSVGTAAVHHNSVVELLAGDKAEVHHVAALMDNTEASHVGSTMVRLGTETVYRAFQFLTGGAISRRQMFVRFSGEDAKLNISGAALLRGKQHGDLTLVVDHAVPNCESRELFKTVLDDQARAVFQGKVIVRPHAQKTDGEQMSQALLLSEMAEFDSKPELEIYADDVVCGHGATSGQIDEELLFYLKARGLPDQQARSILIRAFVAEALEEIEQENIQNGLSQVADAWLAERMR